MWTRSLLPLGHAWWCSPTRTDGSFRGSVASWLSPGLQACSHPSLPTSCLPAQPRVLVSLSLVGAPPGIRLGPSGLRAQPSPRQVSHAPMSVLPSQCWSLPQSNDSYRRAVPSLCCHLNSSAFQDASGRCWNVLLPPGWEYTKAAMLRPWSSDSSMRFF